MLKLNVSSGGRVTGQLELPMPLECHPANKSRKRKRNKIAKGEEKRAQKERETAGKRRKDGRTREARKEISKKGKRNLSFLYEREKIRYDKKVSEERTVLRKDFGQAVERSIRTASGIIWKQNRALLEELAGRQLEVQPRTAQLLAILAAGVKRGGRKRNAHGPEKRKERKQSNKIASADSGEDGIGVNGFLVHLSAQEQRVRHEVVHDSWVALGVAVECGKGGGIHDGLGAAGAEQQPAGEAGVFLCRDEKAVKTPIPLVSLR